MKNPIILLVMLVFICGFCFGAGYVQDKLVERYEKRVEWLSKELEGTRPYYWITLQEMEIKYMRYYRED